MELLELIPRGRDNAISRQSLCVLSGLTDRNVREEISQLRRETPIISSGKGYYLPETAEEVERWIERETRRARSIFWSMGGAKNYLKNITQKENYNGKS